MRPLEPGQPQRRVRSLDGSRKGGLHRRREMDEDFRDLLDDALEGRDADLPPREEDPVSWREQPVSTPDLDGIDRVEIRGRAELAPPAEAVTGASAPRSVLESVSAPAAVGAPDGESATEAVPESTPDPRAPAGPSSDSGGRPRLDLKA